MAAMIKYITIVKATDPSGLIFLSIRYWEMILTAKPIVGTVPIKKVIMVTISKERGGAPKLVSLFA